MPDQQCAVGLERRYLERGQGVHRFQILLVVAGVEKRGQVQARGLEHVGFDLAPQHVEERMLLAALGLEQRVQFPRVGGADVEFAVD